MLVLSRHFGEKVVIGNREIVIEVLDIRGTNVRLGFHASESIEIHREEVFEKLERQQAEQERRDREIGR